MAGRKTILFYTHSLSGGGAERAWALLASGLVRRGHEVIFAVDYESEHNLSYVLPGVRLVTLRGNHITATWRLARLIREHQPDVTISALCFSNLKHTIAALLSRRRKQAIISYHSFWGGEPQLLSCLAYLLTPLLSRLTARTVAVSDALRKSLIEQWGSPEAKTVRIYNPVTWGTAQPDLSEDDLRQRLPVILASGRLTKGKNFRALLQAVPYMRNKTVRVVLLGEGQQRKELEAEIEKLGLKDRVEMPGYVEHPWDYYASASCLVVPSRSESFSMVVVEALAHGLPVVTGPTLGPVEIVANGKYGSVLSNWNSEEIATAMDQAIDHPGDPQPRMQRAHDFAQEAATRAYESLIDDIEREAQNSVLPKPSPFV